MADIEEKTLYNTAKLNLLFLVISLLMAVVLSWMFWDDYDRSWKDYQSSFFTLRRAKLQKAFDEEPQILEWLLHYVFHLDSKHRLLILAFWII